VFFVVFDLEAVFVFAWAVALRPLGWRGYAEALVFMALLLAGLVYLWRDGALDGHELPDAAPSAPGTMMARLPRHGRLAAVLVVAVVALAIVLPAAVRAAGSSPSPFRRHRLRRASAPAASATPATTLPRPRSPARPPDRRRPLRRQLLGLHGDHGQGLVGPSQEAAAFPGLVAGMVTRGGISMPAFRQLSPAQVAAVSDYVATQIAAPAGPHRDRRQGGELFRLYCSGCHSSTGRGGALSQGRNAPSLADYPAAEALAAMILGAATCRSSPTPPSTCASRPPWRSTWRPSRRRPHRAAGDWATSDRSPRAGRLRRPRAARPVRRVAGLGQGRSARRGARRAARGAGRAAPRPRWPAAIGLLVAIAGALGFRRLLHRRATTPRRSAGRWPWAFWDSASPSPTGVAT